MPTVPPRQAIEALTVFAAVGLPLLLPFMAVPDAVIYHQLFCLGAWGLVLLSALGHSAPTDPKASLGLRSKSARVAGVAALVACAALSVLEGAANQAGSAFILIAGCALLLSASQRRTGLDVWVAGAWWLAGVLCVAVGALQYFAPQFADGSFVATNSSPGRAVGNMRQPNHLATALLCAMVMTAWLWQVGRLRAWIAGVSIVAMVLAVALSASRTGAMSLGVLVLWAVIDRRLPRACRWLLALTPLIYLAFWAGLAEYAVWHQAHFYGADRLQSSSDISSSRFAIWKNALSLIAMHPWTGVGWGNFNFAWTFTPFPDRPIAFFDHTHNLVLQLAVEIGLPATAAALGLLLWAMWRARGAWHAGGADAASAAQSPSRAAFMMLVVLAVHSMLEYPLWYAYFLLPAAWALGVFLRSAPQPLEPVVARPPSVWPARLLAVAGVAMIAGAVYAAWDHRRIEAIFAPAPGAAALDVRIAEGQRSWLFGHHADYAAVTNEPRDQTLATFRRPLQQLVDVRLLIAYIEALKANGRDAEALYAAQRLREFRRDDAQAYFKECKSAEPPFQCETTPVKLTWRDLLP